MCKKSRSLQRALTVGSTNLRFPCWIHELWRKLLTKESRSITSNLSKFIYFWGKYHILCRARRWWWLWKIYTHEMEEWHHACGYHTCMYVFFAHGNYFIGESGGGAPPSRPSGVQILSISCSFWENFAKSYLGAPPGGLAPPPWGNPGSATAFHKARLVHCKVCIKNFLLRIYWIRWKFLSEMVIHWNQW